MAMTDGRLYRIAAFTEVPTGGNPAGVWMGASLPDPAVMQRIAAGVGFSETAFVAPTAGPRYVVRYYSPVAEVSFCGHATIAVGAVLGSAGPETIYELDTAVGDVPVTVRNVGGRVEVALTSVVPRHRVAAAGLVNEVLGLLGWQQCDLDPSLPPALAYAGAWHLVLAASGAGRLADLAYEFEALRAVMLQAELTTLQLVWRENERLFHARNPFPVGGVVEDPATGAAAAALGGYLRDAGLLDAPARFEIRQGVAMGRPSRLRVDVPASGGIMVTGGAVEIPARTTP